MSEHARSVTGVNTDFDRAADFLELAAFFSEDGIVTTSDLANSADIGAPEDYTDLHDEMESGNENIVSGTVNLIDYRNRLLGSTYPFNLDAGGDILTCMIEESALGQAAYVLSLVLSNLRSISLILDGSSVHPEDSEVRILRPDQRQGRVAGRAARRIWAGCRALRGQPWAIWERQLVPAAAITVAGSAARTAGSRRRSAIASDTSRCSAS